MAVLEGFKNLIVWQKSFNLSVQVYTISRKLPKTEQFGLIDQMRRSSVSVPSNIAEGYGRKSPRSFLNFVRIASGSLNELETHLLLAKELAYITENELIRNIEAVVEIRKMIHGLSRSLQKVSTKTNY